MTTTRFGKTTLCYLGSVGLLLNGLALAGHAATVTYTIDPNQSSLSFDLRAPLLGIDSEPQFAASDTTSYTGSIVADRTGTDITFTGGSALDAALQPQNVSPAIDGVTGSAPGNYGLVTPVLGGLVTLEAAIRDLTLDLTSAALPLAGGPLPLADGPLPLADGPLPLADGPLPLADGTQFDGSLLHFVITSGSADFSAGGLGSGGTSVIGNQGPNTPGGMGQLTTSGLVETLTIAVNMAIPIDLDGTAGDMFISGQIVGTRTIPEPSSMWLVGLLLVGKLMLPGCRVR